jgi:hypothetical protein
MRLPWIIVPLGRNSMAYDREGNFYVAGFDRIVRFAVGSNMSEVFADRFTDPLLGRSGGGITIDAMGDLYFATDTAGQGRLVRFQGPHNGFLFDIFPQGDVPRSLTSDSCGNLFVGLDRHSASSQLLRYANGDPASKQAIAEFPEEILGFAMALDPTESDLYTAQFHVRRVSTLGGNITTIAEITGASGEGPGDGMAVVPVQDPPYGFTPCPPPIPTVNAWGKLNMTMLLFIMAKVSFGSAEVDTCVVD